MPSPANVSDASSAEESGCGPPPSRSIAPLELAANAREAAGKRLGKSITGGDDGGVRHDVDDCDVERNIREVHAILLTNGEIFDRCMRHVKESGAGWSKFARYSFDTAETHTVDSTTSFVTYPEESEKAFDTRPLMELPAGLNEFFLFKRKAAPYAMFVDYDLFFENSLILHDDVLGPFLVRLKDHLMSVQVCLGSIEAWLMEPMKNINYLEDIFGVTLDIPDGLMTTSPKLFRRSTGTTSWQN